MNRYFLAFLVAISLVCLPAFAETTGTLGGQDSSGNYYWSVDEDGVLTGYTGAAISLGGVEKSSWGSVISPWEDDGTTTTLTSAPTKFILTHASGTLFSTIGDFNQINLENDAAIDNAANGTVTLVEGGDTLSFVFTGNDVEIENSDGGIIFDLNDATAGDSTVDFMLGNDDDDYIQFSTTTNQPLIHFVDCDGKITATDGAISFDNENVSTSGTFGAGATTVTSLIIGDDTADVVTDDQFRFASNDEESTIEAYGYEAKAAVLQLSADQGDDAGDKFQLAASTGNNLLFTSDTATKDTHATILTLAKTGILTTTNDVIVVNDSASTNVVQDVMTLTSSSTGTAAAGLGVGLSFSVEDEGTAAEQQGSIDVATTTATDGAEDSDMIFSINTAGAIAEVVRFVAASSATTGDSVTITQNSTELNAILDILSLTNVTGTATHNTGLGITWDFEDAGGAEEQASLDVQLIVATDGQEDADIIIKQQTDGAVAETFRIVGQAEATTGDYVKITQNTQETNGVLDILVLTNVTGTATTGAGLGISFQPEDATGAEEQASIDVVFTDALNASADVDFVFKQNVAGAIEERVRFDADGGTVTLVGTLPKLYIGDAGAEDTSIVLDGTAQDYIIGLDDTGGLAEDILSICLGNALGTTPILSFNATQQMILENAETIDNVTDDTILFASNDEITRVSIKGFEAKEAQLVLLADEDDDVTDGWEIAASTSGTLTIGNDTGAQGTFVDQLTIATGGVMTSLLGTVHTSEVATALTADTTATITVSPGAQLYTYTIDTDNEDCTLTFSAGGSAGDRATIIFITDTGGGGDEIMTFDGTLSDSAGTLTLADGTAKRYVIEFISDGTIWNEVSRTAVLG